jgi:hydrogenase maturation protease
VKAAPAILIYGYGNPGREDDGAGIVLAGQIEAAALPGVTIDTNYQLNIEDALIVKDYDLVVFADASKNPVDQFLFRRLKPSPNLSYTTHAMHPEAVLALCLQVYHIVPPTYLLEIAGTSYELHEGLTPTAVRNTAAAVQFMLELLHSPTLARFEAAAAVT